LKTFAVLSYQLLNKKRLYFEEKNHLRFLRSFFNVPEAFSNYCRGGFLAPVRPWAVGTSSLKFQCCTDQCMNEEQNIFNIENFTPQ
jgi:hypothetical protein